MVWLYLLYTIFAVPTECHHNTPNLLETQPLQLKQRYEKSCDFVCLDLPKNDDQSVCMMFSRYKKYYQFFINECHARRAICKENLMLHMVHKSRCYNSNQYFMPVNK